MAQNIHILIVDDEKTIHTLFQDILTDEYQISCAFSGKEALQIAKQKIFHVGLFDIRMPGMDGITLLQSLKQMQPQMEVIILTGYASVDNAIKAMKLGAYDYLRKPFVISEITAIIEKASQKALLQYENAALKQALSARDRPTDMVGQSPAIQNIHQLITKIAPTNSSVLIEGESGTGKGLLAQIIHRRSDRADRPFVTVNCTVLQENLLESELFGHERGAFTGAVKQKMGLFEAANTGTLFIDEIGETSPGLQSKLLRVLEERRFRRLGDTKEIEVDVRIIAATNRNLAQAIHQGKFREDLYFRLNVINIEIPPLRDRKEDIPLLVDHLLNRACADLGGGKKGVTPAVLNLFNAYDWPGNVRELANVLEQALILSDGSEITPEDLTLNFKAKQPDYVPSPRVPRQEGVTLDEMEATCIRDTLEKTRGNKALAARCLGISRRNLYRKLKKYGIDL